MEQPFTRRLRAVAWIAASLLLAPLASAAPVYLIDATVDGAAPAPDFSNLAFSLTYEDANFNQQFSLDELLAFTGYSDAGLNYRDQLLAVPASPGVEGLGTDWVFGDSLGLLPSLSMDAGAFTTFSTGPLAGSVPEPTGLALVTIGLLGLAATGRRRTQRLD